MKRSMVFVGLCVSVLLLAQGCERLADLQMGVQPKNLIFTQKEVEDGVSEPFWVWDRDIFTGDLAFTVEPSEAWVEVNPNSGVSVGPWDRDRIDVKVSTSVLESLANIDSIEASIKVKATNDLTKEVKVTVVKKYGDLNNVVVQFHETIYDGIRSTLANLFGGR